MMRVERPADAAPGSLLSVITPSGTTVMVVVPRGVPPGGVFEIKVPDVSAGSLGGSRAVAVFGELEEEVYEPLPDLRFDVTDKCGSCFLFLFVPCIGCNRSTMELGDNEVILIHRHLCGGSKQQRPYAQLGEVAMTRDCCGASKLVSDLTPVNEQGEGGLSPGWYCSNEMLVREIVKHLQDRKVKRGHIGQLKKLDYMYSVILDMRSNMPLVLNNLGIKFKDETALDYDPAPAFSPKSFNLTNNFCPCNQIAVTLEAEEALINQTDCSCSTTTRRREYAEFGAVNRFKACICCRGVTSDLGDVTPGWGCNSAVVNDLVQGVHERIKRRGTIGQIRKQEMMLVQMEALLKQTDALVEKLKLPYPPTQQVMQRLYEREPEAPTPPAPSSGIVRPSRFPDKDYAVTNNCESLCRCCCTFGLAGWESDALALTNDALTLHEKNKMDESTLTMPYAMLDEVDVNRSCCCCYSVNFLCPGWGCSQGLVTTLAEELEKRRRDRGNIAQLAQLNGLYSAATELDIKLGIVVNSMGAKYPPPQRVIDSIYGELAPHVLKHPAPPHKLPTSNFPTKSYDTTNHCISACMCVGTLGLAGPVTKQEITLLPDEMVHTSQNWCGAATTRRPYANLGSVATEKACYCCTQLPEIASPGCGCDEAAVLEIANELQQRKVKRGNIAQMRIKDNLMSRLLKARTQLDVLLEKKGIKVVEPTKMMRS